ncbi:ATP-dependent RNA helicase HrpA [Hamadaea tsunoensis]|uniref:ATP-dependent RNA helicase HrpA n=1 Tax=Hamadaea tsunoensis TaxID=53368 RepID=UPI0006844645|nr:ATP-dependent RNA helicase HrpA [Hamadaea tsunoensis]
MSTPEQSPPERAGGPQQRAGGRPGARRRRPASRRPGPQPAASAAENATGEAAAAPVAESTSRADKPTGDQAPATERGPNRTRPQRDGRGSRDGRNQRPERKQNTGRERRRRTPEQLEARRARVPKITYPEELPVSQRRDEILAAIRDNQVVILAGETGSGKTTQIPKICLELGRGIDGMIGHTQPRRLAARTVADRIAEELGTELGDLVGYQIRFGGSVSEQNLVKLMTDGILLAELAHDRLLSAYDTLIIDEAHERSLNIDFILGYIKQLLPKRPDLKVIITSATIETERFAQHFADADGKPAPVVEVSGRTYPVEVRYRPLVLVNEAEEEEDESEDVRDQVGAICDAVDELAAEGPGDILVFLSGEREIKDTADALNRRNLRFTEVVPLYARLSTAEQHKVFAPHTGRRIVLATNVAETSLTVPGIKYVIDPGTARVSRYSQRLKVQRLPIEPVSQASANQRKGRCGRLSDGICIRLYSEEDFESRPEFTDPEILRTNLASVILQMIALRLGEVADFPFLDPPDKRNVKDGYDLLHELGALDADARLTQTGRRLAQLPVDPRLGRMILEGEQNLCLREVLVIAAALSIQDPRERPQDKQQQAAQSHARFADKESDFLAYINLWDYLHEKQEELSGNQFRRLCKAEYLHYLRVREWQDLFSQLRRAASDSQAVRAAKDPDKVPNGQAIHVSLLAGLLSHIGLYEQEKREYAGARGAKFAIFPGSVLFRRNPRFVMAAELVETSRLWARIVAKVEPEAVEKLAGHLVKRSYSEPHWSRKAGAVLAYERVTLYGVPLIVQRSVNFGNIDPGLSRELFIRHALVEGDWETRHHFFAKNRELLGEVEKLEHRARRRDILVDDQTLFDFYDARVPRDVVSGRHFDAWWKTERHQQPDLLTFDLAMLTNTGTGGVSEADYPDVWRSGGHEFPLTYQFEPGTEADGVTVHIPVAALAALTTEGFDWQIPGLREELVTSLLRSLPKVLRRHFVPAPDHAKYALTQITPYEGTLLEGLGRHLHRLAAVEIPYDAWDLAKLPDYLRMTYRVEDEDGKVLAEGKDLAAIQAKLRPKTREVFQTTVSDVERSGLTGFPDEEIPRNVERKRMGYTVKAYPALHDEGDSVGVRLYESEAEQQKAMWRGTRRLLMLNLPFSPVRFLSSRLDNAAKLALGKGPHGSIAALLDDCVACAVDRLIAENGGPAWTPDAFTALREKVRENLFDAFEQVVSKVQLILTASFEVERRLKGVSNIAYVFAVNDLRRQLSGLIHAGFVAETGWWLLPHVQRYLQAMQIRLEKLAANVTRDREYTQRIEEIRAEYNERVAELPPARRAADAVTQIPWMIEELRVSYFAQTMGTAYPVSDVRIYRAIDLL